MGLWDIIIWNVIRVSNHLYRYPPFYDNEPIGIYKKILSGLIEFPKFFDNKVKDLIRKLLNPEITQRLGVSDVLKNNNRMVNQSRNINGIEESIG